MLYIYKKCHIWNRFCPNKVPLSPYSGWPVPGKTLENLEKPGICNRGLKNLEKLFILKKTLKNMNLLLKNLEILECVYFNIFWFFYDLTWGYFSTSTRTFFPTRSEICEMVRNILKNPACVFFKGPWKWCKAPWKMSKNQEKTLEKPGILFLKITGHPAIISYAHRHYQVCFCKYNHGSLWNF